MIGEGKLFSIFLFLLTITCDSYAGEIIVGMNKQYKSISAAIAAAKSGDKITILQGTYYENNLVIDKRLYISGINYPVIDGQYKKSIFLIRSSGTIIEGCEVRNAGQNNFDDYAGIKVENTHHVIVRNNKLVGNYFGIYFSQTIKCIAENNIVTAQQKLTEISGNAIHCWKTDSCLVKNNTLSGCRDGIYFEFVTNSLIENNYSHNNNRYGLHFMFSHHNKYVGNTFQDNGAGVAVMYTNHVEMYDNKFIDNWGDAAYGLLLKEISDSHISGNIFSNNTIGIVSEGASRIIMEKNLFENNGWAMRMQASCTGIQIDSNNFVSNTFDVGTNGSLVENKFANNYWDKYQGYDLNHDKIGDIPYRPVSLFSMMAERDPIVLTLFRSLISMLIDQAERFIPSLTPEDLKDDSPELKPYQL